METLSPTSLVPDSSWLLHQGHRTRWTKEENKKFESALAIFDEKTPNRWFKVAEMIPGKSVCDVMNQYRELVADVSNIEAGLVPIPGYMASSFKWDQLVKDHPGSDVYSKRGSKTCDQERKKGVPWTQEEHRRFLLGLRKHGKGDWRNISRNYVISKTPTQVASHAQKYYLRQVSGGKDKRRPSIHDITTFDLTDPSTAENNDGKPPRPENPNELTSMQKLTNTPKMLLDWNHSKDGGDLMLFAADFGDSSVTYPRVVPQRTHCIPSFHIQ